MSSGHWSVDFAVEPKEFIQREFLLAGAGIIKNAGVVETYPHQDNFRKLFHQLGYTWRRQGSILVGDYPKEYGLPPVQFDLKDKDIRYRSHHLMDYHMLISEINRGNRKAYFAFRKHWPYLLDKCFNDYAVNVAKLVAYKCPPKTLVATEKHSLSVASLAVGPTGLDENWVCVVVQTLQDSCLNEDWICPSYVCSELPFFCSETPLLADPLKRVRHDHICDKCGIGYRHLHLVEDLLNPGSHIQWPGECPNPDCVWYHNGRDDNVYWFRSIVPAVRRRIGGVGEWVPTVELVVPSINELECQKQNLQIYGNLLGVSFSISSIERGQKIGVRRGLRRRKVTTGIWRYAFRYGYVKWKVERLKWMSCLYARAACEINFLQCVRQIWHDRYGAYDVFPNPMVVMRKKVKEKFVAQQWTKEIGRAHV